MLRILKYLIVTLLLTYVVGWFYYNDGMVNIYWMDYEIETSLSFAVLTFAVALVFFASFYNSLIFLIRAPFSYFSKKKLKNELNSLKKLQIANYYINMHDYEYAENLLNKSPKGYDIHEELTRLSLLKAKGEKEAMQKLLPRFKDEPDLKHIAKAIDIEMIFSTDFALARSKLNEVLENLENKKDQIYFLDNVCHVAGSYALNNELAEAEYWYEKAYKISTKNFKVKLIEIMLLLKRDDLKKADKLIAKNDYLKTKTIPVNYLIDNKKNKDSLILYIGDILVNSRFIS
jgi:hypothetical protein